MPQVKVNREIPGKKKEVYEAVKAYLTERGTLAKLGASIEWDDKACVGNVEASNFEGSITVQAKSDLAFVEILIDLPFLLTPFKGKAEEELKKHLGRIKV